MLTVDLTCRLGTLDIEIYDDRVLATSDYHGFTRNIWAGIDFLMRNVGRNIYEISSVRLVAEL